MQNKRILPALVCGFGVAVISIVPVVQAMNCCVFVPLAGGLGVYLVFKQSRSDEGFKLKSSEAMIMGLLIGLVSGFFDAIFQSILIAVSKTNPIDDAIFIIKEYVQITDIPEIILNMAKEIDENRFSLMLTISIFFTNFIINSIFAAIGGLIGIPMIKRRFNIT
ncbi:MAG: hypothetical protein KJ666_01685 [Bacteroidetes bacterium]|nr:hypothetical protein [Bacteroidota bacterium]MBU2585200.1 hypothetical protein [Bacteroidota bacterium]